AIVQRGLDPLGSRTLCFQSPFGQEARAAQRWLEAGCRVFLDELHGASARKERADYVHAEAGDLCQQRLEVGLRERQSQARQNLAAALLERFLEAGAALRTCRIVPGDPDTLLETFLGRRNSHAVGRLPIGEGGAEHVLDA